MKVCICDIDGVIADPTKRFLIATVDGKIVWEKALSSELLYLDELMPDAVKHLALIRSHYDQLILLTSRYDHMRDVTLAWLKGHGVTAFDSVIFKPWETKRFKKTREWKAERVFKLLQESSQPGLFHIPSSPITGLLVIDDDEANREEINRVLSENMQALPLEYSSFCSSLKDVVALLEKGLLL